MKVSVVIPTMNRLETLRETINSVLSQDFRDFELIIVDGGSSDGTIEYITRLEGETSIPIKLIKQNRKFVTNARNCGIRDAKGEIILFLDDDNDLSKNLLGEIVETFKKYKHAGAVGCVIEPVYYGSGLVDKIMLKSFWRRPIHEIGEVPFACTLKMKVTVPTEVEHLRGCIIACSRNALQKIKEGDEIYFDEIFTYTCLGELFDLTLRIKHAGFKLIFNPRAKAFHKPFSRHLTDYAHGSLTYTLSKSVSLHENKAYAILKWTKILTGLSFFKYLLFEGFRFFKISLYGFKNRKLNMIVYAFAMPMGILTGIKKYHKTKRDAC